ncbi:hypothetical protein GNP79_06960 [Aliivibrio fischeri]|uniref:J domain-containing protein n=1 Tax=Aliivibrio fischeri TaxID=668 RepID=A0A6N3Z1G0_ALIFS|nr:hypothetical protein [Aliivibrio fischeri]MUK44884.1 hypothetical protein [Aliivibrio fischeri]MUK80543.1 hypothetical protein [Aliivibrio fischeri]MUK84448.1 hypothetical protein [Aliivibrio fischeri]
MNNEHNPMKNTQNPIEPLDVVKLLSNRNLFALFAFMNVMTGLSNFRQDGRALMCIASVIIILFLVMVRHEMTKPRKPKVKKRSTDELEQAINRLLMDNVILQEEFDKMGDAHTKEMYRVLDLQDKLDKKKMELDSFKEGYFKLQDRIQEANQTIRKANVRVNELKEELAKKPDTGYSSDVMKLQTDLATARYDYDSLMKGYQLKIVEIDLLSKDMLRKTIAYNELEKQLNKYENNGHSKAYEDPKISELENALLISQAQIKEQQDNLSNANNTIRKANIRINELKKEITDLKQNQGNNTKETFDVNRNCYEWFALTPETANKKTIKEKYKRLSNLFHSDKGGSTSMMQTINQMRDTLMKRHG